MRRYRKEGVSMSDLKPCPFCGSRYINMNYIREDDVLEGAYVECANCGVSTRIYDDPDEVVEFWNRRSNAED